MSINIIYRHAYILKLPLIHFSTLFKFSISNCQPYAQISPLALLISLPPQALLKLPIHSISISMCPFITLSTTPSSLLPHPPISPPPSLFCPLNNRHMQCTRSQLPDGVNRTSQRISWRTGRSVRPGGFSSCGVFGKNHIHCITLIKAYFKFWVSGHFSRVQVTIMMCWSFYLSHINIFP